MDKAIEVRINIQDYVVSDHSYESWLKQTIGILKKNGIPILGDDDLYSVSSGKIFRFDDPLDFGGCVYRWEPNG